MSDLLFDPAKDAQQWDTLPTVSFKNWQVGSKAQKQEIADALFASATDSGFFYLTEHGVEQSLIDAVYAQSYKFHSQSQAYKDQYNINKSKIHRGWVSSAETYGQIEDDKVINNHHEAFDLSYEIPIDDPRASKEYGLIGPNVWPDLTDFKSDVTRYYQRIYQLAREVMAAFEMSLDLKPGTFLDNVTAPPSQLRLLKYYENSSPSDESNVGIAAHSDYECFTILSTSGPGLQVMSAQDHWVEAPPMEGAFLVNVGDCLEAWTGGLFKATQHRVLNLGKERYSLPFFFAADFETQIKPLPQFGVQGRDERYPSFIAGEHLWARTISTFPYLKEKFDSGELVVDFEVLADNPFRRLSVEERNKLASAQKPPMA